MINPTETIEGAIMSRTQTVNNLRKSTKPADIIQRIKMAREIKDYAERLVNDALDARNKQLSELNQAA